MGCYHDRLSGTIIVPHSEDVARSGGGSPPPGCGGDGAAQPTTGLPLATLNDKDVKDFAEHENLSLIISTC